MAERGARLSGGPMTMPIHLDDKETDLFIRLTAGNVPTAFFRHVAEARRSVALTGDIPQGTYAGVGGLCSWEVDRGARPATVRFAARLLERIKADS
jgi:hypothetical protein